MKMRRFAPFAFVAVVALDLLNVDLASAQSCIRAPSGLVSWWPGDGNANDIRDGNNAAVVGLPLGVSLFTTGRVGQGFRFTANTRLEVPDNSNLNPQRLTLNAWVRCPRQTGTTSGAGVIMRKAGLTSAGAFDLTGYELSVSSNGLVRFVLYGSGASHTLSGTVNIMDDRYHHVAVTYDGSAMRLFIDGRIDSQRGSTIAIVYARGPLSIGRKAPTNTSFEIRIDEAQIFNRALSATEIQRIACASAGGQCKGSQVPDLAAVSIEVTDNAAAEPGTDIAAFTLTRTAPLCEPVTVNLDISGTATSGVDYINLPSSVTIAAGSASTVITVRPIDDTIIESGEHVTLRVLPSPSYTVGVPSANSVSIIDNDFPEVSIGPSVVCLPPPSGLVGWWPGDGTIDDIQSTNLTQTTAPPFFRQGVVGQGLFFIHDAYIGSLPQDAFSLQRFTLSAWVRCPDGSSQRFIFRNSSGFVPGGAFISDGYALSVDGGVAKFQLYSASGGASVSATTNFADNVFHHVVATYDGARLRVYVDGDLEGDLPRSLTISQVNAALYIGRRFHDICCTAMDVDEAQVFNRALTPQEIRSIYCTATAGQCKPGQVAATVDAEAAEPGTNVGEFRLIRSLPVCEPLTVNLTVSGSATNGVDYASVPTTVTFDRYQSSMVIPVQPIEDAVVEGIETITLQIALPNGSELFGPYTIGASSTASVSIFDNDAATGSFELSPIQSIVSADDRLDLALEWTVPEGEVWRDLESLDLRLRAGNQTALLIHWDEASNSFEVCERKPKARKSKHKGGDEESATEKRCTPALPPGGDTVLETQWARLHLRETTVVGSGPTGRDVTLHFSLSLKPRAMGHTLALDLAAAGDAGTRDEFFEAGSVTVPGRLKVHEPESDKSTSTPEMAAIAVPLAFFARAYPNPVRDRSLAIAYEIPRSMLVEIAIFDLTGRMVRPLVSESKAPGSYVVEWDLQDRNGTPLAN